MSNSSFVEHPWNLKRNINHNYYIDVAPTNNCQMFTILNAYTIFEACNTTKEVVNEFRLAGQQANRKHIVLIDVQDKYCEQIDSLLKKYIIAKTPYTSTNTSSMCIYLIKITYGLYD